MQCRDRFHPYNPDQLLLWGDRMRRITACRKLEFALAVTSTDPWIRCWYPWLHHGECWNYDGADGETVQVVATDTGLG